MMEPSDELVEFLKRAEGFSPVWYKVNGVGNDTIGYGHERKKGDDFKTPITEDEGDDILRNDLRFFVDSVNDLVSVELEQQQFDALVSFAYNCGSSNLEHSTLLRMVNANKLDVAANEFKKWVYGNKAGKKEIIPGLVNRRAKERAIFVNGDYEFEPKENEV